MITSETIKAKVESIRSVIAYIDELKKHSPVPELEMVRSFAEQQINNYKQLVKDLNNQSK